MAYMARISIFTQIQSWKKPWRLTSYC